MRITPAQMAEIYWFRLRHRAHREIETILRQCEKASKTHSYWLEVKACLAIR